MKAIDILEFEHRTIERMLFLVNKASELLGNGIAVDNQFFIDAVDFIQNYADKKHHMKEEDILFTLLSTSGLSKENGPIYVMEEEHVSGRNYVKKIKNAVASLQEGNKEAAADVITNSRAYVQLLSAHIKKEDNILYPLADKMLNEKQKEELLIDFKNVDSNMPDAQSNYENIIDRWELILK